MLNGTNADVVQVSGWIMRLKRSSVCREQSTGESQTGTALALCGVSSLVEGKIQVTRSPPCFGLGKDKK